MVANGSPVDRTMSDLRASQQLANRFRRAALWLRVHADAFRFAPSAYLQALWWRARGLKLRSRNRMAALAGRSSYAYPYWIISREPRLHRKPAAPAEGSQAIVPVIDCSGGSEGLERTLSSIPNGTRTIILARNNTAGAEAIDHPSQLAAFAGVHRMWLCPIPCGDILAPDALTAYAHAIDQGGDVQLVYADDDLCDESGTRRDPHFKPDWNPELFEWHDFLSGSCVVAASAEDLGKLPDEGWTAALVRSALQRARPVHLHNILHHRLSRPEPVVPSDDRPELREAPLVSIIVPTRNQSELLRLCLEGIEQTDYPALETIIVDNESDDPATLDLIDNARAAGAKVISADGAFNFSALNNLAVRHAGGDLLCFLNNDVEMTSPGWLAFLVSHALRPDLGAVGARLLYADQTIQHAGVYLGIGGGAGHAHRHQHHADSGYFDRARLPQRVSAVTAACMVVEKSKFLAVGGFDEQIFPVAFNDVDLCLKLNARGWQSFYEPRATLIHHESRSRGSDRAKSNRARFANELAALKRKWGTDMRPDPFHHPNLSPFCEQFLIAI